MLDNPILDLASVSRLPPLGPCVYPAFQPHSVASSSLTIPCSHLSPIHVWLFFLEHMSPSLMLWGLQPTHFLTVFSWELSAVPLWWHLPLLHLLFSIECGLVVLFIYFFHAYISVLNTVGQVTESSCKYLLPRFCSRYVFYFLLEFVSNS